VSLEDMYNGTTRKLALQKNVICDSCEGQLTIRNDFYCCLMRTMVRNRVDVSSELYFVDVTVI
jgi:hypothetical protein